MAERLSRLAAVDSAGLLALFEVGPDLDPAGAGVYLASECAPGGQLADPSPPLGPAGRVSAIATVAEAAHALHEAGIAHGSIGWKSVLITDRGAVLEPPPLDSRPGLVARIGDWRDLVTVSPELLRGESASRSSDIWSLGATLHVVLSERPLYAGIETDAPVTALQRILFNRPEVDPDLPTGLSDAIAACLHHDPGSRPETALDLATELRAAEVLL
jgi:hypothetical protein